MDGCPKSRQLIHRVAARLQLASFGRSFFRFCILIAAVYSALLVASRGAGWMIEVFDLYSLLTIPALGVLLAIIFYERPAIERAATEIDQHDQTGDVFLTLCRLETSAGSFQPLVVAAAERRAESVRPSDVVGFRWQRRLVAGIAVGGGLILAVSYFPQFDPFGRVEAQAAVNDVRQTLRQTRQETQFRLKQLQSEKRELQVSTSVNHSLGRLSEALQRVQADLRTQDIAELTDRQTELQSQWKKLRDDSGLQKIRDRSTALQQLGGAARTEEQWLEEIAKGRADSVNAALEALGEQISRLPETEDLPARRQLEHDIRKQLAELHQFADDRLDSVPLEVALERARQQLESGTVSPELESEATRAATESLELAQEEISEVARSARELQALEEGLRQIQLAKQRAAEARQNAIAAEDGQKTGAAASSEGSAKGLVANSSGNGQSGKAAAVPDGGLANAAGQGIRGAGSGQVSPENEQAETAFRHRREATFIDASRQLLSLKRRVQLEPGEATQEYTRLIRAMQSQLDVAVEVEEIPPGYVDGIRDYFSTLESSGVPPTLEDGEPGVAGDSQDAGEDRTNAENGSSD